jgi:hypothetical protein
MNMRWILVSVIAVAVAAATIHTATGQSPAIKKAWTPPRTADGQPDLQGVWNNGTITPMERPPELAGKAFFTEAEAAVYEKRVVENFNADRRRSDAGTDLAFAYNDAWWDRGTKVVRTRRTSLIVDPADGRLPPLMPAGQKRAAALAEYTKMHPADGPQNRLLSERCLIWPTAGPPMLPVVYNNNYQIFQAPGYVTIEIEMIHDVRIIPLDGRPHLPSNVRQWLGDSRGHWEGNTLVVETTNFIDKTQFPRQISSTGSQTANLPSASEKMRVIEHFTRTDPGTILYEFTVEDGGIYMKPWTAQLTMWKSQSHLYEYACHEGNYGMAGILAGARSEERNAPKASQK